MSKILTILFIIIISSFFAPIVLADDVTTTTDPVILSATVETIGYIPPELAPYLGLWGERRVPKIFAVQVSDITRTTARITWQTDLKCTTELFLGPSLEYELGKKTDGTNNLEFVHEIILLELLPGTVYHFKIRAQDSQGTVAYSGDYSFQTLSVPDMTPPAEVLNFTATPGNKFINLTWQNPEASDLAGVVILRSKMFYPEAECLGAVTSLAVAPDVSPTECENVVLVYDGVGEEHNDVGLTNGVRYYYTAFTYDFSGNFSSGAIASAVPGEAKEAAPEVPYIPPYPEVPTELTFSDFRFFVAHDSLEIRPMRVEVTFGANEPAGGVNDAVNKVNKVNKVNTVNNDEVASINGEVNKVNNDDDLAINSINNGINPINPSSINSGFTEIERLKILEGAILTTLIEKEKLPPILKTIILKIGGSGYVLKASEVIPRAMRGEIEKLNSVTSHSSLVTRDSPSYELPVTSDYLYRVTNQVPDASGVYPLMMLVLIYQDSTKSTISGELAVEEYGRIRAEVVRDPTVEVVKTESGLVIRGAEVKLYEVLSQGPKAEGIELIKNVLATDSGVDKVDKVDKVNNGVNTIVNKVNKVNKVNNDDDSAINSINNGINSINNGINPINPSFINNGGLWPARDYYQFNPQVTNESGEYGFMVPNGKYLLEVKVQGRKPVKTQEFEVADNLINHQVVLKLLEEPFYKKFGLLEFLKFLRGLLLALGLGVLAVIVARETIRRKLLRNF